MESGAYQIKGLVKRSELPEYESNPSVSLVSKKQKIGTKRITNKTGDKAMIISESGEILAPAGFYETVEVDSTQFVKLYINGVKIFNELTAAGAKVFSVLYKSILKNPNTDEIYLHRTVSKMATTTFERGLTELLNKEIIYKSGRPFIYFLNVDYMFNGNRLAFIKEYKLRDQVPDQQQELPAT